MAAVVGPALRGPGPSRELLIALVLLSRHRATTAAPRPSGRRDGGRAPRTSELLRDAAANRHDAKYFDLHAAALEIDSIDPEPLQDELARSLDEQWEGLVIRSDQRTVEDAKLGLVRRFGAALRERERRRNEAAGTPPGTAAAPPPLPYERLLSIGTHEPSHAVRTAIAHQIAAGGDAAFRALRELFPLDTDPVRQYLHQTREAKRKLNEDYTAWLEDTEAGRAAARGRRNAGSSGTPGSYGSTSSAAPSSGVTSPCAPGWSPCSSAPSPRGTAARPRNASISGCGTSPSRPAGTARRCRPRGRPSPTCRCPSRSP